MFDNPKGREQHMSKNSNSTSVWNWRLPVVLSIAALAIALLGSASAGQAFNTAASAFAKRAGYARNAGAVSGIKASRLPKPGRLVPLGPDGKFPASVGLAGPQGPQGLKGPKGDKGDTGPQGAAGTNGVSGWGYYIQEQDIASKTLTTWSVSCPAGQKVLGGGVSSTNPLAATVAESAPTIEEPMGWGVAMFNNASTTIAAYAWAICASVS
jgi:hypothetical protein